jgi:hypothetical protein
LGLPDAAPAHLGASSSIPEWELSTKNRRFVDLLLVLTFGMRLQKYVGAMIIMIDRQDMARQVLSF